MTDSKRLLDTAANHQLDSLFVKAIRTVGGHLHDRAFDTDLALHVLSLANSDSLRDVKRPLIVDLAARLRSFSVSDAQICIRTTDLAQIVRGKSPARLRFTGQRSSQAVQSYR